MLPKLGEEDSDEMTRCAIATPTSRAARALLGVGAAIVLALAASGCASSSPVATPTPDPFSGLAERSDQAFREGLDAYGDGKFREALAAFDRARLLSPSTDPRIEQMMDRTRAAMAPTATPVPPTATSVPAVPTATPVALSTQFPDTDLGQRYFGQVSLTVVPSKDAARATTAAPATQFFYQDQIGLRIDALTQRPRLPLMLRVFNADASRLVAEVRSDEISAATPAARAVATPTAATQTTAKMTRFLDDFVWYHEGGEEPGRYRLELYANGTLTNTFDYVVGTVPVPTPTAVPTPAVEATALPKIDDAPPPPPVVNLPPKPAPAPAAPAAPAAPVPPAEPTPVPHPPAAPATPTPGTAGASVIGGVPAGLDVSLPNNRVLIADASGVVWTSDQSKLSFNRPFNLDRLPVDLGVDQSTGNVFVSVRTQPAVLVLDSSGRLLKSITLPGLPGDLQVDSELGLLYVALPEQQALGLIDMRAGRLIRTVDGMPQVTSMSIDPERHVLYASHLGGQVTSVDVVSAQVTGRVAATGPGLSGVAASRGVAYAVNTATHELAVVDTVAQGVTRFALRDEPAAIAASEETGVVYVLASKPNAILRIDPTDGSELGRVNLLERSGRFGMKSGQGDFQGLRPRMLLNRYDESVYVTLPEAGTLSVVPQDQFPQLTYAISTPELGEAYATSIPGVMRPAAAALPDMPTSQTRAQTAP